MIDALAHQPDPYPAYARLLRDGIHRLPDGRWVVARTADVVRVLDHPAAIVGFSPADDRPLSAVQATMARFSDGAEHDRRRAVATASLRRLDPARLRERARELTAARLRPDVDLMAAIARDVPLAVLAEALGVADVDQAVAATRRLATALAPPAGAATDRDDEPARTLLRLLSATHGRKADDGPDHDGMAHDECLVNIMALLFQATDATAGLIGNTVLAATRHGLAGHDTIHIERFVTETARHDPPVQLTTRVAARALVLDGRTVAAGDRMIVHLAAADRDPARHEHPERFDPARRAEPLTFGTGPRPCPGRDHALALACGVIEAVTTAGLRFAGHPVTYERRANLRIPARLVLTTC